MKAIPLSQGKVALVDDEFFDVLSKDKWYAHNNGGYWYAVRKGGKLMHRDILKVPAGLYVDHKNGNGLDNRLENLRQATNSQNQANKKKRRDGAVSVYKGVEKIGNRWRARIRFNQKFIHIGLYKDEKDAARAYDAKAIEFFGEYARTNF